ncbi:hypothetical protein SBV1_1860013 [Verrucomicrobia bacterium]|nr:hypothetical protein SBV1_1860013 [Verrucomicrobiota bacterium]
MGLRHHPSNGAQYTRPSTPAFRVHWSFVIPSDFSIPWAPGISLGLTSVIHPRRKSVIRVIVIEASKAVVSKPIDLE